MTRAWVADAALLALTPAAVGASDGRGFVELRLHGYSGVEGQPVQTIQRLRPELITDLFDRISLTVGVELAFSQGGSFQNEWRETLCASALGPVLEAAQCTWPEEEKRRDSSRDAQADALRVTRCVPAPKPPVVVARTLGMTPHGNTTRAPRTNRALSLSQKSPPRTTKLLRKRRSPPTCSHGLCISSGSRSAM